MDLTRRQFLQATTAAGVFTLADRGLGLSLLQPAVEVGNPLESYPDRNWERIYRDQYRYDSTFDWVCSPNDTHACRVRAFVRNGIVTPARQQLRLPDLRRPLRQQSHGQLESRASAPRATPSTRRIYGPYRLKHPIVRKGWKAWADAGFPELTATNLRRSTCSTRAARTSSSQISWDDAFTYIAKALVAIAERYSGEEGGAAAPGPGLPARDGRGDGAAPAPARSRCAAAWACSASSASTGCTASSTPSRSSTPLSAASARTRPRAAASGPTTPGTATRPRATRGSTACRPPTATSTTSASPSCIIMDGKNLVENKLHRLPLVHRD